MNKEYKFKKNNIADFLETWFAVEFDNPENAKMFKIYGVDSISINYWRCFPAGSLFDNLLNIEKMLPNKLKFLFTHFNYVGVKK